MSIKNTVIMLVACLAVGPAVSALTDPKTIDAKFRIPALGCGEIAHHWLRAAFHESGTYSQQTNDGGTTGSLQFEWQRPENSGLRTTVEFYLDLVRRDGISFADAVVYGGKVAVEVCGGPIIPFKFGRVDVTEADPENRLPGPAVTAEEIKNIFMRRLGLTAEETVAYIGGGHAIGGVHAENTLGVKSGPFDTTEHLWDNRFFIELLRATPPGEVTRLESDSNMARDPEFRPIVEKFAKDAGALRKAFVSAYVRMSDLGARFDPTAPSSGGRNSASRAGSGGRSGSGKGNDTSSATIAGNPTGTIGIAINVLSTTIKGMNPTQVPQPTWAPATNSGPMLPGIPQLIEKLMQNPKYPKHKGGADKNPKPKDDKKNDKKDDKKDDKKGDQKPKKGDSCQKEEKSCQKEEKKLYRRHCRPKQI